MIGKYNSIIFSVFSIFVFSIFLHYMGFSIIENAYGLQEEYYDELDENYEQPQYDDDQVPQNPDPEFMEEVEPGEYDQSDDVTEMNDRNYW